MLVLFAHNANDVGLPNLRESVIRAEYAFKGTATTFPSDPVEFFRQLVAADHQGERSYGKRSGEQNVLLRGSVNELDVVALQGLAVVATEPPHRNSLVLPCSPPLAVLGCHQNWLGIREMTLKLSNHTNIPIIMFGDTTLLAEKDSFYEALQKLKVRVALCSRVRS